MTSTAMQTLTSRALFLALLLLDDSNRATALILSASSSAFTFRAPSLLRFTSLASSFLETPWG